MDNVSLIKTICHRNFGNEFAFTHSKDYLYYKVWIISENPIIAIVIISRDGSMYLPAVLEVPYFNRNEKIFFIVVLRDRKLILLLSCSRLFDDSTLLFSDVIGPCGGKLQR